MSNQNDKAVAVLVFADGDIVAQEEREGIFIGFGYESTDSCPSIFYPVQTLSEEEECAFQVLDEGKEIRVFGNYDKHLEILNSIVRRFGWASCDIKAIDKVVERKIEMLLKSVLVRSTAILQDAYFLDDSNQDIEIGGDEFGPTDISLLEVTHLEEGEGQIQAVANLVQQNELEALIDELQMNIKEKDLEIANLKIEIEQNQQNLALLQRNSNVNESTSSMEMAWVKELDELELIEIMKVVAVKKLQSAAMKIPLITKLQEKGISLAIEMHEI